MGVQWKVKKMNRREMRQRISAIIAVHLSSIVADSQRMGLPMTKRKTLAQELRMEFEIICKFKEPSYAMRRRWERAISEVAGQLLRKDPYFRDLA